MAFSSVALQVLLKLKLILFVQLMLRKNEYTQDEFVLSRTNRSNNVDQSRLSRFTGLLWFPITRASVYTFQTIQTDLQEPCLDISS